MPVLWDFVWWVIALFSVVAYFFVVALVIVDLFRDSALSGWWKVVWVVLVIFIPFPTALVYVIARGRGMAARSYRAARRAPEVDDYAPAASKTPSEDIARAKALLDEGTITQGEFDALKSKALGNQYFGA